MKQEQRKNSTRIGVEDKVLSFLEELYFSEHEHSGRELTAMVRRLKINNNCTTVLKRIGLLSPKNGNFIYTPEKPTKETAQQVVEILRENAASYKGYQPTQREYFAAMAMQGILSDQRFVQPNQSCEVSKRAVENADALIAELNK